MTKHLLLSICLSLPISQLANEPIAPSKTPAVLQSSIFHATLSPRLGSFNTQTKYVWSFLFPTRAIEPPDPIQLRLDFLAEDPRYSVDEREMILNYAQEIKHLIPLTVTSFIKHWEGDDLSVKEAFQKSITDQLQQAHQRILMCLLDPQSSESYFQLRAIGALRDFYLMLYVIRSYERQLLQPSQLLRSELETHIYKLHSREMPDVWVALYLIPHPNGNQAAIRWEIKPGKRTPQRVSQYISLRLDFVPGQGPVLDIDSHHLQYLAQTAGVHFPNQHHYPLNLGEINLQKFKKIVMAYGHPFSALAHEVATMPRPFKLVWPIGHNRRLRKIAQHEFPPLIQDHIIETRKRLIGMTANQLRDEILQHIPNIRWEKIGSATDLFLLACRSLIQLAEDSTASFQHFPNEWHRAVAVWEMLTQLHAHTPFDSRQSVHSWLQPLPSLPRKKPLLSSS